MKDETWARLVCVEYIVHTHSNHPMPMKANIERTASFTQTVDAETGDVVDVYSFDTIITFEIPVPHKNATLIPEFIGSSTVSQAEADSIAFGKYSDTIGPQVAFLNANIPV